MTGHLWDHDHPFYGAKGTGGDDFAFASFAELRAFLAASYGAIAGALVWGQQTILAQWRDSVELPAAEPRTGGQTV
jgi:hypothetical protein